MPGSASAEVFDEIKQQVFFKPADNRISLCYYSYIKSDECDAKHSLECKAGSVHIAVPIDL